METKFEKASRIKLRFKSDKGSLTVEQLWDLTLEELNSIAIALNKTLKDAKEEDFLKTKSVEDTKTKLAFDIVLYILETKKAEMDKKKEDRDKKAKKEKLLEILDKKREDSLHNLSEEELLKKLNELED